MKKSVLFSLIVISLVLLTSCQPKPPAGERPLDTAAALQQVKTGTRGVELSLLQDSPPNILYDQNELIALVELKNRGSSDLQAQQCFVQITGFDPNIITGAFNSPRSCAEGIGVFEGKNLYNTEGGTNLLQFESSVNLPLGVPDYSPTLNFLTCYNYRTIASPSVCVDPLFYQVSAEQKTCRPNDVPMAGGQGGPVGVSYVGVDMVGDRAIFEINVRNMGGGRVLSPFADIRNCGKASIEYQDLDKVGYNVEMTGGSRINCKPNDGFVRLTNGQGKIICSFSIPGSSAFETPLIVDLDYSYIDSFRKEIRIIQTPQ
jgi:hypothetical protein